MSFRSCFLLSSLFVFAFPLAVQEKGNWAALHKLGNSLSVRNDADASNSVAARLISDVGNSFDQPFTDKAQLPSKDFTVLPGLDGRTESPLLADNVLDAAGASRAAWGAGATAVGAGMSYGSGLIDLLFGSAWRVGRKGQTATTAEDTPTTDDEEPCGVTKFKHRNLAWCDYAFPESVAWVRQKGICVGGFPSRLFSY